MLNFPFGERGETGDRHTEKRDTQHRGRGPGEGGIEREREREKERERERERAKRMRRWKKDERQTDGQPCNISELPVDLKPNAVSFSVYLINDLN
jgi:hypothetical protein